MLPSFPGSRMVVGAAAVLFVWIVLRHIDHLRPIEVPPLPWNAFDDNEARYEMGGQYEDPAYNQAQSTIDLPIDLREPITPFPQPTTSLAHRPTTLSVKTTSVSASASASTTSSDSTEEPSATATEKLQEGLEAAGNKLLEIGTGTGTKVSRAVVMGKRSEEDTDWVGANLRDWDSHIYVVDLPPDAESPTGLKTKVNKAKEATPYLTYILDNYPNFPNVSIFLHSHRKGWPQAWHNEGRNHDAVNMLQKLKLDTVMERGYVNLRCLHEPGCPNEISLSEENEEPFKKAFPHVVSRLFNVTEEDVRENMPVVATPCCAQFAVSREQLLKRSKEEYEHYLKTIHELDYDDDTLGRAMEYSWHLLFGQKPDFCEEQNSCYAALYGKKSRKSWKQWKQQQG